MKRAAFGLLAGGVVFALVSGRHVVRGLRHAAVRRGLQEGEIAVHCSVAGLLGCYDTGVPSNRATRQPGDPAHIRSMFASIASRYDRANNVLSAGVHHRWRRRAVRRAPVSYKNLTLPTTYSVLISVVAGSLKKKIPATYQQTAHSNIAQYEL